MHIDDKGISLTRGGILRQHQPAFYLCCAIPPMHVAHLAPCRFNFGIKARDLRPIPDRAHPHFRGSARRLTQYRSDQLLAVERAARNPIIASRSSRLLARPQCLGRTTLGAHAAKAGVSVEVLRERDAAWSGPRDGGRRGLDVRSEISCRSPGDRDDMDVPTRGTLITHQPFDED